MRPLVTAPGFFPDLEPDAYFAEPCPAPALTASGISTLLRCCPAKFAYEHPAIGQPAEEKRNTAATYMGSLVHRLALGKGADYAISPHDDYRSGAAKAWKAETEAASLIPVKEKDFEAAERMAEVVRAAIAADFGGRAYQTEVVIAWQRRGRWCRAMVDVWCPDLLRARDVKTAAAIDDRSIDKVFGAGYGRQQAWYTDGLDRITGRTGRVDFGFLFVEKEAPFFARSAAADEAMRHGSTIECDRAFEIFDTCMGEGQWPAYPPRKVTPSSWQVREWADAEFMEAA